ncbi:MAG: histidine--tRNA ligase [Candidatus Cloacimonadota bacterium]|nr:MAG: histidine--tRNA ligase [Candidatus Cloacimonadota bacterium]
MEIRKIKGTKDILPDETEIFLAAEKVLRETMIKYGYREIRIPTFEQTELFKKGTGVSTDIVTQQMYSFTDRGERNISLRPEGTPSVVRAYLENNLHKKRLFQKFFYYGRMFRQESPQSGRLREFNQFGIESIGSLSPQIDAETIILGLEVLRNIGLKRIEIHLNSIGCDKCRPSYKKSLKEYLKPKLNILCNDCKRRFNANILRVLDCKRETCRKELQNSPVSIDYLCDECKNHFSKVKELLQKSNVSFTLNPYLVRGLDYYTKTVYEFISPVLSAQDAVGGGGRYDRMIELFGGPPIPAIGFACGMERILLAVEKEGGEKRKKEKLDCYIATMDDKTDEEGFLLLNNLREKGLSCEKDFLNRSLKAQMKDANRLGADFVVIIGPEEMEKNEITIRMMSDSSQKRIEFSVDAIVKEIR